MNNTNGKLASIIWISILFFGLYSCSNTEFKPGEAQVVKSKNILGTKPIGTPSSLPIFAPLELRVRPDTEQKIRIGEFARYQAFVRQDDGLSSETDVTEKVTWKVASGSQFVSPQGIANHTFGIMGSSAGAYTISAVLATDAGDALVSNVVIGNVSATPVTNQVCEYGPWVDAPCSKVCGGGNVISTRPVTIQPPALLCADTSKSASCNMDACPSSAQPVKCQVVLDKSEVELGKPLIATIEQTPQDSASLFLIKLGDQSFARSSAVFTPIASGQVTATVTNAGGPSVCTPAAVVVKQPELPPLPACNLVAATSRLPFGGGSVQVKIERTNVAPVDHSYIDSQEGSIRDIKITQTTVIRGSVENAAGSVNCVPVTIDVLPPPPPAPTCHLTASTTSLPAGGGDVQFSIQVTGSAEKIVLDGTEGQSRTIKILSSRIVEGSVQNQSGSNKCNAAINVAPPVSTAIPTCTLALDKTTLAAPGGAVVATMNVSGPYTSASINGTQGMTLIESITGTKSYLGIVSSASGSSSCSVTATVSPPTVIAPTCALSIDKSSLPAGGGQVVLNLTINGTADSSTIDGVAGTALTKNVTTAKQFTATVSNTGGVSSCSAFVDVAPAIYCAHGPAGRVMLITTDEKAANACRDEANDGLFASPGGLNCSGDPNFVLSVSRCDSLASHAVWKHRSVQNAGKCVRFNPTKCYQASKVYWLK